MGIDKGMQNAKKIMSVPLAIVIEGLSNTIILHSAMQKTRGKDRRYMMVQTVLMELTALTVLPGYIDTDSIRMMTGPLYEPMKKVEVETHPFREAASADDASEAIALLCLDEARWLNGQVVQNDGAGLFAMQGRFFQVAATGNSGTGDSDAPIIGI